MMYVNRQYIATNEYCWGLILALSNCANYGFYLVVCISSLDCVAKEISFSPKRQLQLALFTGGFNVSGISILVMRLVKHGIHICQNGAVAFCRSI